MDKHPNEVWSTGHFSRQPVSCSWHVLACSDHNASFCCKFSANISCISLQTQVGWMQNSIWSQNNCLSSPFLCVGLSSYLLLISLPPTCQPECINKLLEEPWFPVTFISLLSLWCLIYNVRNKRSALLPAWNVYISWDLTLWFLHQRHKALGGNLSALIKKI